MGWVTWSGCVHVQKGKDQRCHQIRTQRAPARALHVTKVNTLRESCLGHAHWVLSSGTAGLITQTSALVTNSSPGPGKMLLHISGLVSRQKAAGLKCQEEGWVDLLLT